MKIPTDLQLLNLIYDTYYKTFESFNKEERSSKMYVPIDIDKLGQELGVDGDIVFGRLYYHLNNKFGYTNESGAKVDIFCLKVGGDTHAIHFAYMASILADLRYENKKYRTATTFALISLGVSLVSISIALF